MTMCGLADMYRRFRQTFCFMHPEAEDTSVVTDIGTCSTRLHNHISEDTNVDSGLRDFTQQILFGW